MLLMPESSLISTRRVLPTSVGSMCSYVVAFLRTDGCPLPPIKIAIQKAFTAARERSDSRALGDKAREEDFPLTNFGELGYVGWGGGVHIVVDGEVIGAIGVSGLPETDDMELARWAAASFASGG